MVIESRGLSHERMVEIALDVVGMAEILRAALESLSTPYTRTRTRSLPGSMFRYHIIPSCTILYHLIPLSIITIKSTYPPSCATSSLLLTCFLSPWGCLSKCTSSLPIFGFMLRSQHFARSTKSEPSCYSWMWWSGRLA